jgi:hypothetical protein
MSEQADIIPGDGAGALALRDAVRDLGACPDLREFTCLLAAREASVQ